MISLPPRPSLCLRCYQGGESHPSAEQVVEAAAAGVELHVFEPGPRLVCAECGREITDAEAAYHCIMANPASQAAPARGWHCWECHVAHYHYAVVATAQLE